MIYHTVDGRTLAELVAYDDAGKAIAENITPQSKVPCPFLHFPITLGGMQGQFTTVQGLIDQIDHFTQPVGLVYYFSIQPGAVEMKSVAVDRGAQSKCQTEQV